jgi:hypothetical protein
MKPAKLRLGTASCGRNSFAVRTLQRPASVAIAKSPVSLKVGLILPNQKFSNKTAN